MVTVHNKALNRSISVDRIIQKIEGNPNGPTVVFFAGIHGNETSGVLALEEELKKIAAKKDDVQGTIYAICGNLKALEANSRYIKEDLNRMWQTKRLSALNSLQDLNPEEQEQLEVFKLLNMILSKNQPPYYFIDLHTTSSKTLPFITINDATINRKFSELFPVPIVLGIEEYLDGPLLSYINELGYVSLGFESGQHTDEEAIKNATAFINLTLLFAGSCSLDHFPEQYIYYDELKKASKEERNVYEVIDLHRIEDKELFEMLPGFRSFQEVKKGMPIASSNGTSLQSDYNANIFMPLYQKEGKEGFFIIKKIKPFYLKASLMMRRLKLDNLLSLLPGIAWEDRTKNTLIVDLKVVKYLAKPIFHLLGFRNRQINETHIRLHNRERASKLNMYKNEFWFKGY